jgi:hypothetical protein
MLLEAPLALKMLAAAIGTWMRRTRLVSAPLAGSLLVATTSGVAAKINDLGRPPQYGHRNYTAYLKALAE